MFRIQRIGKRGTCILAALVVFLAASLLWYSWWSSPRKRVERLVEEIECQGVGRMNFPHNRSSDAIDEDFRSIGPAAIEPLISILEDAHTGKRWIAAMELGRLKDKRATVPLARALWDSDEVVRLNAAAALSEIADERSLASLIASLDDPSWGVRMQSAAALGRIGSPDAILPLIATLDDGDYRVRETAERAIREILGFK